MVSYSAPGTDLSEAVTREAARLFAFPLGTDVSGLNKRVRPTSITGVVDLGDSSNDGVTRTQSRESTRIQNSFSTYDIQGDPTITVATNLISWDRVIQALVRGEFLDEAPGGTDLDFTLKPNMSSKPFSFGLVMDYPGERVKLQRDVYPEVTVTADVANQWSVGTDLTLIPVTFTATIKGGILPYVTYGFKDYGTMGTSTLTVGGALGGLDAPVVAPPTP